MGDEEVQDWFRQQGEGGVKGQAKRSREIVWAHSEMLELDEGDVMEKLDKELAGDVLLVRGESLNSDKDGEGGDNKDVHQENGEENIFPDSNYKLMSGKNQMVGLWQHL